MCGVLFEANGAFRTLHLVKCLGLLLDIWKRFFFTSLHSSDK